MFKGKRGAAETRPLMYVGEAVIVLIVLLAMLVYVKGLSSGTLFEQNFLARDAALTLDSAYAAPGEVEVKYDVAVSETKIFGYEIDSKQTYDIVFDDSKANVYGEPSRLVFPATYPFAKDSNLVLTINKQNDQQKTENKVIFEKKEKEMVITQNE